MASTIQIKNSNTVGNSPASLTQGELAINVNDGNLFYGNGSSVKQDLALSNITGSNITASGDIITTNLKVDNKITHIGDTDTYLQFAGADDFRIIAGGIDVVKATASEIAFNDGQANYDFRVEGDSESNLIFADASADKVGIGTNAPGTELEVIGDISSSGTLTANTISSTTDIDITTNNEFLRGKTTGGATRSLIGISSDNRVEVGNTTVDGLELIADPAITASCDVISGSAIVKLKPRLELPKTSTVDGDNYGTIVYFGSNTSGMTAGTIYYYRSTGAWVSTQADSTTTSLGLLGVALGSAASNGVLIQGTVTLNHDPGALGDTLYLSDTNAGRATSTAPSSTNDVVRVVGYCLDASNGQIYFNPSSDHIVHA